MIPCVCSAGPLTRCRCRYLARTVADMATSYPMLPAPYSLSRSGAGSGIDGYRERAARVFGQGMGSVRGAVRSTGRQLAGSYAALGRAGKEDTLGGLVASQAGPAAALYTLGLADETETGKALYEATGGWIRPSTAIAAIAGILRGLNIDRKWLPRPVVSLNTAIIKGTVPLWLYGAGGRTMKAIKGRMGSDSPQLSGAEQPAISGATEQQAEIEPIPGEETRA